MSVKRSPSSRHALNLAGEAPLMKVPSALFVMNTTTWSGSGAGTGLSSTVLATEKIATLAPILSASAARAVRVKPGARRNIRTACFRLFTKTQMVGR
jgi:hypothetical protein